MSRNVDLIKKYLYSENDGQYKAERFVAQPIMLTIYGLLVEFGIMGLLWLIITARSPQEIADMIAYAAPIFGSVFVDAIALLVGIGGFFISPKTKHGREITEFSDKKITLGIALRNKVSDAKNSTELIARKEKLFKIYQDIYKLFDRVYFLEVDKCEREAWIEMGMQLDDMYDALSYHKRTLLFSSVDVIRDALRESGERYDMEIKHAEAIRADVDKLTALWSSPACLNGVRVLFDRGSLISDPGEGVQLIGNKLAMDKRVAAYYDQRIPVEDLMF